MTQKLDRQAGVQTPAGLIEPILAALPATQAVYLYGTWGTEYQRRNSDLDIAVLLPPAEAKTVNAEVMADLSAQLSRIAKTESTDLINLRRASTLLRKEVVVAERLVYCADRNAVDEFEMLTLSFYQKLMDEQREIIASGLESGRFYDV